MSELEHKESEETVWSYIFEALFVATAICFGTGLSTLYLIHILPNPYTLPGSFPDGYFFAWNFYHLKLFVNGAEPLYTSSEIFSPHGASLYLHTLVEGVGVPLAYLLPDLPPARLYTVTCLFLLSLNFFTAFLLFLSHSEKGAFALLFAPLLAFHPFFIAHVEAGHLNFLVFFPVLYVVHFCLESLAFLRGRSLLQCVALSFSIALLVFCNLYYLYYCAIMIGITSVIMLGRRRLSQTCLRLLAPVSVGLALGWSKLQGVIHSSLSSKFTPNHDPEKHSADLMSYLLPGEFQWIADWSSIGAGRESIVVNSGESGLYLGIGLFLLLLLTLQFAWRTARGRAALLSTMVVVFGLFSFGPVLRFGGERVFSIPTFPLLMNVPFFPSVPARFGIMVVLAAFLLVAIGLKEVDAQWRLFVSLLLGFFLFIEYFPTSPGVLSVKPSPVVSRLGSDVSVKSLYDAGSPETSMARQFSHRKRIAGGMLARRPKRSLRFYKKNRFLKYVEDRGEVKAGDLGLREGFDELEIDGVLIPKGAEGVARLEALSWLSKADSDEELVFFKRKT